jgi:hypothetical protein
MINSLVLALDATRVPHMIKKVLAQASRFWSSRSGVCRFSSFARLDVRFWRDFRSAASGSGEAGDLKTELWPTSPASLLRFWHEE